MTALEPLIASIALAVDTDIDARCRRFRSAALIANLLMQRTVWRFLRHMRIGKAAMGVGLTNLQDGTSHRAKCRN